jgi:hypothetical protein
MRERLKGDAGVLENPLSIVPGDLALLGHALGDPIR